MINLAEQIKKITFLERLQLDNKKIALIVLVSAAIFYVDFNFIFKAQLRIVKKSSAEAAKLRKDLVNFELDFKKMQENKTKQALPAQKTEIKIKNIIPENYFSSLLQDISKAANNNEVRILQLRPSRERETPGPNPDSKVKVFGKLTPFFIALDLSSGYHNLGKFINELENLPAFVKVQDIRIEPQLNDYLRQRASLILVTYVEK